MKIRLLTSIGGTVSGQIGDVIDQPERIALAWIAERIAEPVEEPVAVGVEAAMRPRARARRG